MRYHRAMRLGLLPAFGRPVVGCASRPTATALSAVLTPVRPQAGTRSGWLSPARRGGAQHRTNPLTREDG